jgi:hypothetical protein
MSDKIQAYLTEFVDKERPTVLWFALYCVVKFLGRVLLSKKYKTVQQVSINVWDPICLVHNILSVSVGLLAIWTWKENHADACTGLSDQGALVITLQACHAISDFLIFLPQLIDEPVLFVHHFILIVVSVILPYCEGCFYVAIAFSIAEFGSASIAVDAEWRKAGGQTKGFTRMVVFGTSRVINLYFLYRIYLVTPVETLILDDYSINFSGNMCMITSVGGGAFMLGVNGVTWYRMFTKWLKKKNKSNKKN